MNKHMQILYIHIHQYMYIHVHMTPRDDVFRHQPGCVVCFRGRVRVPWRGPGTRPSRLVAHKAGSFQPHGSLPPKQLSNLLEASVYGKYLGSPKRTRLWLCSLSIHLSICIDIVMMTWPVSCTPCVWNEL